MCFASTQCKVFAVDDSWSLAPFCGRASCRIVETKDKGKLNHELRQFITRSPTLKLVLKSTRNETSLRAPVANSVAATRIAFAKPLEHTLDWEAVSPSTLYITRKNSFKNIQAAQLWIPYLINFGATRNKIMFANRGCSIKCFGNTEYWFRTHPPCFFTISAVDFWLIIIFISSHAEGEDKKFLAEQVEDCGPLIDLELTTGCELLPVEDQTELEFPDCCPQYDCAEGTEIIYVNATAPATTR